MCKMQEEENNLVLKVEGPDSSSGSADSPGMNLEKWPNFEYHFLTHERLLIIPPL